MISSQILTDNTIRIKTIINKLRMVSVQTTTFYNGEFDPGSG